MTERQALVKAMLAEPDDDLPRLVFADWLDENGEPERAAFIRLQVEAARRPQPEQNELLRQAGDILSRHCEEWLWPFFHFFCELNDQQHFFQRGMLSRLAIREDQFLRPEVQEQLAAWAADNGIDLLNLTRDPSVRATWSKVGTLARVMVNTLRGKYADCDPPSVHEVASPVLASVAALRLTGSTADDHGLRVLAHSSHVALLSGLTLNEPPCTDAGLDSLARSQHLPNLRALNLELGRRVRFTAEGVLKVLASDRLPRLCALGLFCGFPVQFDLTRVLNHPVAGRLTRLRLNTPDALAVVARSRQLTRLESLELIRRQVVVTSEMVSELLANPMLAALKQLRIWLLYDGNARFTTEDTARLRDRFGDDIEI